LFRKKEKEAPPLSEANGTTRRDARKEDQEIESSRKATSEKDNGDADSSKKQQNRM